jgi:hypothetical protein
MAVRMGNKRRDPQPVVHENPHGEPECSVASGGPAPGFVFVTSMHGLILMRVATIGARRFDPGWTTLFRQASSHQNSEQLAQSGRGTVVFHSLGLPLSRFDPPRKLRLLDRALD